MTTLEGGRSTVDARPIRPISPETPWDHAIKLRNEIASEVQATLDKEGLDAAIFVSSNGQYPPQIKLEAWIPSPAGRKSDEGSRERAELEFIIDVKPYHEHEIVLTARLKRGKKQIALESRPEFPPHCIAEWTRYALDRGPKPSNYTPIADAFMHIIISFLPFIASDLRNHVSREYRTRMTFAMVIAMASLLAIALGGTEVSEAPTGGFLLILAGVAGLVAAALIVRFRERAVAVTAQPVSPPRSLVLVDSWHVVVAELGRDFANVKRRLISSISEDTIFGITAQREFYTHRTPNGYDHRERLVVAKDQGMVHVHIYQFGHDAFVGWHAYLNWAQWGESNPISVKILERREVEFRDLRPTFYVPTQFDLIDLSSLSEFVHRRLERELKALIKEKSIDQEIDFKIIRGDRDRALDEKHHGEDKKKGWSYRTGA